MSESETTQHGFSMADVAGKPVTWRRALASGKITVGEQAYTLLKDKSLPKGDAMAFAWRPGYRRIQPAPGRHPWASRHPSAG